MMFSGDASRGIFNGPVYDTYYAVPEDIAKTNTSHPCIQYIHNGVANVTFWDGHVGSSKQFPPNVSGLGRSFWYYFY